MNKFPDDICHFLENPVLFDDLRFRKAEDAMYYEGRGGDMTHKHRSNPAIRYKTQSNNSINSVNLSPPSSLLHDPAHNIAPAQNCIHRPDCFWLSSAAPSPSSIYCELDVSIGRIMTLSMRRKMSAMVDLDQLVRVFRWWLLPSF